MKILFYSHTSKVSGAEKILLLLIERLNRMRFSPFAVCSGEGPLQGAIEDLGVPCRTIPELTARFTLNPITLFGYLGSVLKTARAFRRESVETKPDLIHANSIRAGIVATIATTGKGIPVFWHLQDELGTHPLSTLIRLYVSVNSRIRLVGASAATLESFRGRLLNSAKIDERSRVVHNVVDTNRFRFNPDSRAALRLDFDAGEDDFLIGVIGQITPRKGQKELIEAFSNCLSEIPNARLLIVGEPMFNSDHEYLGELEEIVCKRRLTQSVSFLGFRDDIPQLMSALDTVVINSKSEAFVVVGIECLATGAPVIATDVGGIREMLVDGESGLIVTFGDQDELQKALIRIVRDSSLRDRISRNGTKVVKERLNAEVFAQSVEEFFESAVSVTTPPDRVSGIKDVKLNA